jgi:hypothetical protein
MGAHTGSVRVYGATRLRWLAPLLRPTATLWLWQAMLIALIVDGIVVLISANLVAATAVVLVPIALWAGLVAARLTAPRLMELQRDADRSARRLAADDPLRDELAQRQATLGEQMASIGAEVEQRTRRLQSLATQSSAFAIEETEARRARKAAERARRTIARADAGIADTTIWGTRIDPATDFAERAESILAAYRELSNGPTSTSAASTIQHRSPTDSSGNQA